MVFGNRENQDDIQKFEERFSAFYGYPRGVVLPKARIAFYQILKYLNLTKGREVIITALHLSDFVNMIHLLGLTPVFVDLKPGTVNIDYNDLEKKVGPNTAALLLTHLSGYATDIDQVERILKKHEIPLIQDCSQAFSTFYKNRPIASYGYATIFSLSLLKPVCTFVGGMVISKDQALIEHLRVAFSRFKPMRRSDLFRVLIKMTVYKLATTWPIFNICTLRLLKGLAALSRTRDLFAEFHTSNLKLRGVKRSEYPAEFSIKYTRTQAQTGLELLQILEEQEEKRRRNGLYLRNHIKNPLIQLPEEVPGSTNGYWLFPVFTEDINHLKQYLLSYSIDSFGFLLTLLADEACYAEYANRRFDRFDNHTPQAREIRRTTLFIPVHVNMTPEELEYVVSVVNRYPQ